MEKDTRKAYKPGKQLNYNRRQQSPSLLEYHERSYNDTIARLRRLTIDPTKPVDNYSKRPAHYEHTEISIYVRVHKILHNISYIYQVVNERSKSNFQCVMSVTLYFGVSKNYMLQDELLNRLKLRNNVLQSQCIKSQTLWSRRSLLEPVPAVVRAIPPFYSC